MTLKAAFCTTATTDLDAAGVLDTTSIAAPKRDFKCLFDLRQSLVVAKELVCSCMDQLHQFSKIAPMMVGFGFLAPPDAAPWIVQIQRPEMLPAATSRRLNWDDRQFCGGAVIAPGWIVTAAHCLTDYGSDIMSANYRVRIGITDIADNKKGVSYAITAIYPHPEYDRKKYSNDIALVKFEADLLTEPVDSKVITSIELDSGSQSSRVVLGKVAFVFGWGLTENESPSAPLLAGSIRIEADNACKNSKIAVCGKGTGTHGSTQCHGDSGGPLVRFEGEKPVLIGVVSHNIGKAACGTNPRPGVYTRISGFYQWIERRIGRESIRSKHR